MVSRRSFLKAIPWAPLLGFPRSFRFLPLELTDAGRAAAPSFALTDFRLTPHYPAKSPLEEVVRRQFAMSVVSGRDRFLEEIKTYFSHMARVETAEFDILAIEEAGNSPLTLKVEILYTLIGMRTDTGREQRIGKWLTQWSRD